MQDSGMSSVFQGVVGVIDEHITAPNRLGPCHAASGVAISTLFSLQQYMDQAGLSIFTIGNNTDLTILAVLSAGMATALGALGAYFGAVVAFAKGEDMSHVPGNPDNTILAYATFGTMMSPFFWMFPNGLS